MENKKNCCECKKDLKRSKFHRASARLDGLQSICKKCASSANIRSKRNRKKVPKKAKKGTCRAGDKVLFENKLILVQDVLDYDPELKKSYVKGCAIDGSGIPLLGVDVLAGYDWEFKKSF